jgi:hypothetical protein
MKTDGGKWYLGGLGRKWEDIIKVALREVHCEDRMSLKLTQDEWCAVVGFGFSSVVPLGFTTTVLVNKFHYLK